MKCLKCGAQLSETAKFCEKCGAQVQPATEQNKEHIDLGTKCNSGETSKEENWFKDMSAFDGAETTDDYVNTIKYRFKTMPGWYIPIFLTALSIAVITVVGVMSLKMAEVIANDAGEETSANQKTLVSSTIKQENVEHKKIRGAAMAIFLEKLGGLCDKTYDEKLVNITYGTLTSNGGNTRFPAIVANYDFGCIKSYTGDRVRNTEFWVILGYDEFGGVYRCLKTAGKHIIDPIASDCNFRPES